MPRERGTGTVFLIRTRSDMTNITPITYALVNGTDSLGALGWVVEMSGLSQLVVELVYVVGNLAERYEFTTEVLMELAG